MLGQMLVRKKAALEDQGGPRRKAIVVKLPLVLPAHLLDQRVRKKLCIRKAERQEDSYMRM